MRDRRAERHEATRREIVEAAWELCRSAGLAALSLRDLARRIGMQAPSLYSYFDSKHAIYDAMFAAGFEEFVAGQPDLARSKSTLSGVRKMMRYFVGFCTADPVRYHLLFQRTIPGFEPSPESYAISVDSLQRVRNWFVSVGLDRDFDLYTAVTVGLTDQQIANDPGGDRWTRLVDEAAEMLLDHARSRSTTSSSKERRR